MGNELQTGNSSQDVNQNENLRAKDTEPQNVTVILPDNKEEVSVGSIVLQVEDLTKNIHFVQYNLIFAH
jgi:hypothetical protein